MTSRLTPVSNLPLILPALYLGYLSGCKAESKDGIGADDSDASGNVSTDYCAEADIDLEITNGELIGYVDDAGDQVLAVGISIASRATSCTVRSYDFSLHCTLSDAYPTVSPDYEQAVIDDNGEDIGPNGEFTRTLATDISEIYLDDYDAACQILVGESIEDEITLAEEAEDGPPAEFTSFTHTCSGDTLAIRTETIGRLDPGLGAHIYVLDATATDCEEADGEVYLDGYYGRGDCWEELHTLEESDVEEGNASASYRVNLETIDLESSDDLAEVEDGTSLFRCDYLDNEGVEPAWVVFGYDISDASYVCVTDGDQSKVPDQYRCP